jgi:putative ABC transport system permease protein
VRTATLLATARELLGRAVLGLAVVAGVSLIASLLVLVSVMAAGRTRQIRDAIVLHALGVSGLALGLGAHALFRRLRLQPAVLLRE